MYSFDFEYPKENGVFAHVTNDSWFEERYVGVYKPKVGMTTKQKSLVVSIARELAVSGILYHIASQIDYVVNYYLGTEIIMMSKIEPLQILGIRCDGVIEYCYEQKTL